MNEEKWENLLDTIEIKFGKLERRNKKFVSTDDMGNEIKNEEDWVEFKTELGRIKVSRFTRPLIIDKKYHYNRSSTGMGQVEYVLSEDEISQKIKIFKWDEIERDREEISIKPEEMKF